MKPLSDELASRLQDWGEIAFHPDPQFNLQFNRYCVDAGMISTMHAIARRVKNVDDWHREMQVLAEIATAEGNNYRAQSSPRRRSSICHRRLTAVAISPGSKRLGARPGPRLRSK